ncbi:MAG: hypothetical protein QGH73_18640 [Rhodospirillales bacterium]|jgi:hypothetical protein|nr:hypothetical protein [Rhodospirillales bacterium]MDP6644244.1 hypothetical protein [Rhodospirillales bacterium]MDP6843693.1 hypothetical protein [Rhodospirillales bacterium]
MARQTCLNGVPEGAAELFSSYGFAPTRVIGGGRRRRGEADV